MPAMFPKAYRFVGEMDEIADFVGEDPAAKKLYEALADSPDPVQIESRFNRQVSNRILKPKP